mmetsp:Transcript_22031/g.63530  ORF Transcript_22031/g.63530 Transcript_22031/m.63530 type:complete len:323 (-) Transcript_22031:2403-3371(-)
MGQTRPRSAKARSKIGTAEPPLSRPRPAPADSRSSSSRSQVISAPPQELVPPSLRLPWAARTAAQVQVTTDGSSSRESPRRRDASARSPGPKATPSGGSDGQSAKPCPAAAKARGRPDPAFDSSSPTTSVSASTKAAQTSALPSGVRGSQRSLPSTGSSGVGPGRSPKQFSMITARLGVRRPAPRALSASRSAGDPQPTRDESRTTTCNNGAESSRRRESSPGRAAEGHSHTWTSARAAPRAGHKPCTLRSQAGPLLGVSTATPSSDARQSATMVLPTRGAPTMTVRTAGSGKALCGKEGSAAEGATAPFGATTPRSLMPVP